MKLSTFALLPLLAFAHEDKLVWSVSDVKLPAPISDMTATLGPDDLVLIAGGCSATLGNVFNESSGQFQCSETSDAFYSFNATTSKFQSLPPLPRPRYRHGAAFSNNKLWLVGGRHPSEGMIVEVDVFDFNTNQWSTPGDLPQPTSDNAAFSDASNVYVAGGWNESYYALQDVWKIKSTSDTFEIGQVTSLREARGDVKAVVNGEGLAFVAGGFTDANGYCPALATVEQYDIAANTWTNLDELKSPRGDKALVELEGHLVAIGGEAQLDNGCSLDDPAPGEATAVIDDVELLNDKGVWEIVASIPDSRFRFDAVSIGDQIYTFGGMSSYNEDCKCYKTTDEILIFTDSPTDSGATTASKAIAAFLAVGLVVFGY